MRTDWQFDIGGDHPRLIGFPDLGLTMFKEHEQIVLTDTVRGDESETLKLGTSGTVVHVHPGARGYVVEFPSLEGSTPSIATVLPFQARLQKSAMSPQSFAVRIREGNISAVFPLSATSRPGYILYGALESLYSIREHGAVKAPGRREYRLLSIGNYIPVYTNLVNNLGETTWQ